MRVDEPEAPFARRRGGGGVEDEHSVPRRPGGSGVEDEHSVPRRPGGSGVEDEHSAGMKWSGWGAPGKRIELGAGAPRMLRSELGETEPATCPRLEEVVLPE